MIDFWLDFSNFTLGLHFDRLNKGTHPTKGVALYIGPLVFVLHGLGVRKR